MANTSTRDSIYTRVLDYADMTGSAFPVEARVNEYIDTAMAELWYLLCSLDPSYGLVTKQITLADRAVVTGANLSQTADSPSVTNPGSTFITSGVTPGDVLSITAGNNTGTYYVRQVVSETNIILTTNLQYTVAASAFTVGGDSDSDLQEVYTLSQLNPPFWKLRGVYLIDGDRRYRVERLMMDEQYGMKMTPVTAETLEIQYIPECQIPAPSTSSDAIRIPEWILPGWDDYIALCAAVKLLAREESDTSTLMRLRDEAKAQIMQSATPRDIGVAERVVDVSRRWNPERIYGEDSVTRFKYRLEGMTLRILEVEAP